jgi:hypothetical protein
MSKVLRWLTYKLTLKYATKLATTFDIPNDELLKMWLGSWTYYLKTGKNPHEDY